MTEPWLKAALLPPMPFLGIAVAAVLLSGRRGGPAWWCALAALVVLTGLATPLAASRLLAALESDPPLSAAQLRAAGAQAVVVLSAEAVRAPEYGGYSVGPLTLVRLRYAARVQSATGLPLLVSGGTLPAGAAPVAETMRRVLEDEFRVPVAWAEDRSQDTWENARFSAEILRAQGIGRVLLVTHAWHMRRSVAAFRRAGIEAVAAPTGFVDPPLAGPDVLIPSARALADSYYALYELLGGVYYRLARS